MTLSITKCSTSLTLVSDVLLTSAALSYLLQSKPKSYGMVISEDQLRMVWAGEIGFSLLIVLSSVLIAIAS